MKNVFLYSIILLYTGISIWANGIQLQAVHTTSPPKVDGKMNDPAWQQATPFTHFKMIEPDIDKTPSEKTEVRILFDSKNLYIGVHCYTQDPSQIVTSSLRQDQGERDKGNDLVRVLLDPFQDKRNAYVFFVTAGGARTDGLASGEHMSTNWDGIWDAKSKIHKDGWTTEIKIPFKTINFKPGLQTWGFNLERYIPKKMETLRLAGISRDSFFYNPAEAASLGGIKDIKQGLGLTLKPYTTVDTLQEYDLGGERHWNLNFGFDLYKNFTPNLVGVITYNTDFAETEVDERRINLTRFPLYYPEKRSFFLEGSEIFNFSTGLHRSFVPFFSRNIGMYDEDLIPINYGAKVFGKIGDTNVALLDVRTKPFEEMSGRNFFAGRIYQNIFSESKAGIIFTSGNPSGAGPNNLVGLDFTYSTSRFLKNKNFNAGAWYAYNWNTLDQGNHSAYGFRVDYPNDLIDTSISYRYFGDAMEPGLAYLPRNGVRSLNYMFIYKPRPQNGLMGKLIRQHRFELFLFAYWDLKGELESVKAFTAPINIRTESGDHFEFNIIPEKDTLSEPFELSEDFFIPMGTYTFTRYGLQFHSASHRPITAKLVYRFGDYYNGKLSELQSGLSLNFKGNIHLGLEGVFVRGHFPQGEFNKNLYRVKTDFFLNSDMGLMSYIQYDDVSGELGANIRLKWRISPGNTIYLVYDRGWERNWDPHSRFIPLFDRGVFKIQLTVRP